MKIKALLTPDQRHALSLFAKEEADAKRAHTLAAQNLNRAALTILRDQLGPEDTLDLTTWAIMTPDTGATVTTPPEAPADG